MFERGSDGLLAAARVYDDVGTGRLCLHTSVTPSWSSMPLGERPTFQLRIADSITRVRGSIPFVYIHVVVFECSMLFVDSDPWPRLTLIVSLDAILLSTFVMIGQNRQAEVQPAKADHDFVTEAQELRANTPS